MSIEGGLERHPNESEWPLVPKLHYEVLQETFIPQCISPLQENRTEFPAPLLRVLGHKLWYYVHNLCIVWMKFSAKLNLRATHYRVSPSAPCRNLLEGSLALRPH